MPGSHSYYAVDIGLPNMKQKSGFIVATEQLREGLISFIRKDWYISANGFVLRLIAGFHNMPGELPRMLQDRNPKLQQSFAGNTEATPKNESLIMQKNVSAG
jgi:hypothetical protein